MADMSDMAISILAVETSGYEGSIALRLGDVVVEDRSLAAEGRRNAQTLVQEVEELLKRHNMVPQQIDAIAVSEGPGSFTGLRVGIVFAKTFAWVNDAELIAVDTLQAIAKPLAGQAKHVTVISDAQRNEVFVNSYGLDGNTGVPDALNKIRVQTLAELYADTVKQDGVITGPGLTKHKSFVETHSRVVEEKYWQPTASAVAEIASQKYMAREFANAQTLEPVYIRRSYAEEKKIKG